MFVGQLGKKQGQQAFRGVYVNSCHDSRIIIRDNQRLMWSFWAIWDGGIGSGQLFVYDEWGRELIFYHCAKWNVGWEGKGCRSWFCDSWCCWNIELFPCHSLQYSCWGDWSVILVYAFNKFQVLSWYQGELLLQTRMVVLRNPATCENAPLVQVLIPQPVA